MKPYCKKLLTLLALLSAIQQIHAATVSGTVGYPDDTDTALLTSGSSIFVYLNLFTKPSGIGYIGRTSTSVGISAGNLTAPFSINVPTEFLGKTPASYRISYSCSFNHTPNNICSTNENSNPLFAGLAWYTPTGMVPVSDDSSVYTAPTSLSNIDIRFLRRPTARGTISFPAPLPANESIQVSLTHYNSVGDFPKFFSDTWSRSYLVSSGATEFDYIQPSNFVDTGFYIVEASCNSDCDDFLSKAFYNSSGGVPKKGNAEQIPFDSDLNNRDFGMLAGKLISLTVTLPNNAMPETSFENSVALQKLDDEGMIEVAYLKALTFGTSDHSKVFEFRVPPDESEGGYRVFYQCFNNECKNYFPKGYFNSAGTKLIAEDAEIIPYDASLSGLVMQMIRGQRFDGEFKLPGNATASELTPNLISATLLDADCNPMSATYQSNNLALSVGDDSRSYVLDIPMIGQSGYFIHYVCAPESVCTNYGWEGKGWVGATTITASQTEATFFSIHDVPETLDISVIDADTPANNPEHAKIGGKCSGSVCVPIKAGNGNVALICL